MSTAQCVSYNSEIHIVALNLKELWQNTYCMKKEKAMKTEIPVWFHAQQLQGAELMKLKVCSNRSH